MPMMVNIGEAEGLRSFLTLALPWTWIVPALPGAVRALPN
jgi:hypothetical protein